MASSHTKIIMVSGGVHCLNLCQGAMPFVNLMRPPVRFTMLASLWLGLSLSAKDSQWPHTPQFQKTGPGQLGMRISMSTTKCLTGTIQRDLFLRQPMSCCLLLIASCCWVTSSKAIVGLNIL